MAMALPKKHLTPPLPPPAHTSQPSLALICSWRMSTYNWRGTGVKRGRVGEGPAWMTGVTFMKDGGEDYDNN